MLTLQVHSMYTDQQCSPSKATQINNLYPVANRTLLAVKYANATKPSYSRNACCIALAVYASIIHTECTWAVLALEVRSIETEVTVA